MKYFVGNRPITIDQEIGKGGEGTVFSIRESSDRALKIFHPDKAKARTTKINALVDSGIGNSISEIAFPLNIVKDHKGIFSGFEMNLVKDHAPLHSLYGPESRKQTFPHANLPFLIRAARNTASLVKKAHLHSCVIGDLNHSSILYSPKATCAFIDADSFQFKHNGKLHRCLVGTPEYTAPEIQGSHLSTVERTVEHDYFALGVAIFRLLAAGKHPYMGVYAGGSATLDENIKNNRFAFTEKRTTNMRIPPASVTLADFPDYISEGFEKSFAPTSARTSAEKWIELLRKYEANLITCSNKKTHHIFASAKRCIWCEIETITKKEFFPPVDKPTIIYLPRELTVLLENISSLKLPIYSTISLKPSTTAISIVNKTIIRDLELALNELELTEIAIKNSHERLVSSSNFNQLKSKCIDMAVTYQDALKTYHKNARNPENHLNHHFIKNYRIRGIGSSRLTTLVSYGVETAEDVDSKRLLAIPGFGPKNIQPLLKWRQDLERSITTKKPVKPDHAQLKSELEKNLILLKSSISQHERSIGKLTRANNKTAVARAQYELAVSTFKKINKAKTPPTVRTSTPPKTPQPKPPVQHNPTPKPPRPVQTVHAPTPKNPPPITVIKPSSKTIPKSPPPTTQYQPGPVVSKSKTQQSTGYIRISLFLAVVAIPFVYQSMVSNPPTIDINQEPTPRIIEEIRNVQPSDLTILGNSNLEPKSEDDALRNMAIDTTISAKPLTSDTSDASTGRPDSLAVDSHQSKNTSSEDLIQISSPDAVIYLQENLLVQDNISITDPIPDIKEKLHLDEFDPQNLEVFLSEIETPDKESQFVTADEHINKAISANQEPAIATRTNDQFSEVTWEEEIVSNSASSREEVNIVGYWSGSYICSENVLTDVTFEVESIDENRLELTFTFSPANTTQTGSFLMTGNITNSGRFTFSPVRWIKELVGYSMVSINGVHTPGENKLDGEISFPKCHSFTVNRQ